MKDEAYYRLLHSRYSTCVAVSVDGDHGQLVARTDGRGVDPIVRLEFGQDADKLTVDIDGDHASAGGVELARGFGRLRGGPFERLARIGGEAERKREHRPNDESVEPERADGGGSGDHRRWPVEVAQDQPGGAGAECKADQRERREQLKEQRTSIACCLRAAVMMMAAPVRVPLRPVSTVADVTGMPSAGMPEVAGVSTATSMTEPKQ